MTDARNGGGEASSSNAGDQPVADPTRNQDDAQNNASSSIGVVEEVAPSKVTSKASSRRNSTPAASLDVRSSAQTPNDASSAMEDVQQSQETAIAPSKSAHSSAKDSEDNEAVPSSYGTRSRNRPGRLRPNYAEDTEMDFEMAPASANGNMSDAPSRDSVATDSGHSSSVGGKKGSGGAAGNASWGNSGPNPKDNPAAPNIPGTTAASAAAPQSTSASQPTTKRRKNAAANATNGTHGGAAPPNQPGAKRGNTAMVVAAHAARETNMMTFERTGAILKNGHMEADDGQIVSINGKL